LPEQFALSQNGVVGLMNIFESNRYITYGVMVRHEQRLTRAFVGYQWDPIDDRKPDCPRDVVEWSDGEVRSHDGLSRQVIGHADPECAESVGFGIM
jgi:hypothetical protein